MASSDELSRLIDGSAGFDNSFRSGDVVDLGGGITWQLSADLARDLNRSRARRSRPERLSHA